MERKAPNIILASYPRSGNTYLRNILFDVYNIFSWNNITKYDQSFEKIGMLQEKQKQKGLPEQREKKLKELQSQASFPIIKTHEMPDKVLQYCDNESVIIYIVRDGRDALVSQAHHNVDIVNPGSNFNNSLKHSILALKGSHFGGWSKNVKAWQKIASKVIYFEELIRNPLEVVESLKGIIDLAEPNISKLPTLESQREGSSYFGGQSRSNFSDEQKKDFNRKFFRSGKTGVWKNEMSVIDQKLFWKLHGKVSEEFGYGKDGSFEPIDFK